MVSTGNTSEAHGDFCAARCLRSGNDPKDAHCLGTRGDVFRARRSPFSTNPERRNIPFCCSARLFHYGGNTGEWSGERPNLRGKEERGPPPEQLRSDDGANRNNMLVCGDDIVQHSGYMLCECVLYGCSNAHGGPEQMFQIEETTLDIYEPKGKYPVSDIRQETTK